METRYLFVALSVAILLGLYGCLGQEGELYLVPDKADSYLSMKPSAILSDPDFKASLQGVDKQQFDDSLQKAKDEFGMDPLKVTKLIVFMSMEKSGQSAPTQVDTTSYGGAVVYGEFDQAKVIEMFKAQGPVEEIQYEGTTIYRRTPAATKSESVVTGQPLGDNQMDSIAFADGKTVVFGTVEAVKDCIDVKNGKRKPLSDESLTQVANEAGANSMVLVAMKIPEYVKSAYSQGSSGPVDTSALAKLTHLAASYDKAGSTYQLRVASLFPSGTEAEKAKGVLDGIVVMAKGFTKSGSATEKLAKDLKVGSSGNLVTIGLDMTKETWDKAQAEWNEANSQNSTSPP